MIWCMILYIACAARLFDLSNGFREMVELPELENEILAGEVYDEVSGSGETESGTRRCESGS